MRAWSQPVRFMDIDFVFMGWYRLRISLHGGTSRSAPPAPLIARATRPANTAGATGAGVGHAIRDTDGEGSGDGSFHPPEEGEVYEVRTLHPYPNPHPNPNPNPSPTHPNPVEGEVYEVCSTSSISTPVEKTLPRYLLSAVAVCTPLPARWYDGSRLSPPQHVTGWYAAPLVGIFEPMLESLLFRVRMKEIEVRTPTLTPHPHPHSHSHPHPRPHPHPHPHPCACEADPVR
jgi:hypothetical protein